MLPNPLQRSIVLYILAAISVAENFMKTLFAVGFSILVSAVPMLAHHSFAAEYDAKKPVKVSGTVTKMEWMNPHARFYVDVKDDTGRVTSWNFELGAIPTLLKQGWKRDSLKAGDQVTVE